MDASVTADRGAIASLGFWKKQEAPARKAQWPGCLCAAGSAAKIGGEHEGSQGKFECRCG